MRAKAKRDEAQSTRNIARFLSVDSDKAMFERHAQEMDREAERLERQADQLATPNV
jgi:hypothetical protein